MKHRGISPVIAVILIVMLVITAVGITYLWIDNVLKQQKEEVSRTLATDVKLFALSCFENDKSDSIRIGLSNNGETQLDMSKVDIHIRDVTSSQLVTVKKNLDWSEKDFSAPKSEDIVSVTFNNTFEDRGEPYVVQLTFPQTELSVQRRCTTQPGSDKKTVYYRNITIVHSGQPLSNYQVRLQLNTKDLIQSGKLHGDCTNLAIRTNDGNTIPYWIDTPSCNTPQTAIWTKVPNISSGNTTLRLEYGDIDSIGESGENTFLFFDDFETYGSWEDMQARGWQKKDATVTIAPGKTGQAAQLTPGENTNWKHYVVRGSLTTEPYVLEMDYKTERSADGPVVKWTGDGNWWGTEHHPVAEVRGYHTGAGQFMCDSGESLQEGQWTDQRYLVNSTFVRHWIGDEVQFTQDSCLNNKQLDPPFKVGWNAHAGWGPAYIDNIRVRKYAATSPTVMVGAEQESV